MKLFFKILGVFLLRLTPTQIGGRTLFHRDVVNEFAKVGTKENIRNGVSV